MRRVAKRVPAKPSRGAIGTAPVPADEVARQINQDEGVICLDNDLGADWTGNIDCDGSANNKPKRRSEA
jgi:hypothetical protein